MLNRKPEALLFVASVAILIWTRHRWWPVRWRMAAVAVTTGAKPFWMLALGFVVAWILARLTSSSTEQGIRVAGLVLQWLGLALVAQGIGETRARFGEPSLVKRVVSWSEGLRSAFGRPRHISLTAQPAMVHVRAGSASLSTSSVPSSNIGARLRALEEAFEVFRAQAERQRQALIEQVNSVSNRVSSERQERVVALQEMNKLLAAQATGGIVLEVIGVVWLGVGAAMGAVPEELAKWFVNG